MKIVICRFFGKYFRVVFAATVQLAIFDTNLYSTCNCFPINIIFTSYGGIVVYFTVYIRLTAIY